MSAQFVALALSYCLGRGTISLKGVRKRPWLEIQRRETELTYLNHQLRQLHKFHDGKLEAVSDVVQTNGFYDDHRIRVHSPDLFRVYDLLYFRDERRLTPEVLQIVGAQGLTSLWCDTGTVSRNKAVLRSWASSQETAYLKDWVESLGHTPALVQAGRLEFHGVFADDLIHDLRKTLPRCKLSTLRR